MTQNELYEQLRKRVYEIIYPEGIPLEVGCEIEAFRSEVGEFGIVVCGYSVTTITESNIDTWRAEEHKNLGKPLSLQDLLRAIHMKKLNTQSVLYPCYIDCEKPFFEIFDVKLDLFLPLSTQEPEVLEKLINLLK